MTLSIILIFTLITLIFQIRSKTKLASFTLIIILLLILLFGQGTLSQFLLNNLQQHKIHSTNEWGRKNLIIVLGAGTSKWPNIEKYSSRTLGVSRVISTAAMYHHCIKSGGICHILTSGGKTGNKTISEAEIMKDELIQLNLTATDILLEDKSFNTFQNAEFTKKIIDTNMYDKIFLITSGFHLNRALLYFSHFNIQATGIPADFIESSFSLLPSSHNLTFIDLVIHEHLGILRFHFYNFFNLNRN